MDTSILSIIIVGAIAAIGGYLFGMADSRVTNAFKETREKEAAVKQAIANEKQTVAAAAPRLDDHNVLNVSLDPALKWHLQLDGVPLEPDGLSPEQRARLVNVIVQIRPWIDGKVVGAPVTPPVSPAPAGPPPPIPGVTVPMPATVAPVTAPAAPAGPPRIDIARGFRSLLENEVKKPEALQARSIIGMIDDVLQRKLAMSPLADRHIRLEEGSVGEVIVYVGVQRYSGVDAVPDEAIKALIKQAIAEWDKQ
jgi:hypothetical protein